MFIKKFDTIVDIAGGGWLRLREIAKDGGKEIPVKSAKDGGRYIAITPDEPWYRLNGVWGALKVFLFGPLSRALHSRSVARSQLPAYTFAVVMDADVEIMRETFKLSSEGRLKACVDDRGAFDFTTEGAEGV